MGEHFLAKARWPHILHKQESCHITIPTPINLILGHPIRHPKHHITAINHFEKMRNLSCTASTLSHHLAVPTHPVFEFNGSSLNASYYRPDTSTGNCG